MSEDNALFDVVAEANAGWQKPKMGYAPYAGDRGNTGGHVDTEASKARAEAEVDDGSLDRRQASVERMVRSTGAYGATWKEVGEALGYHHGQASAALTQLHQAGRLVRLTQQRGRCSLYVTPDHVEGRETTEPARTAASLLREAVGNVRALLDSVEPDGMIPVALVREAIAEAP